VRVPNHYGNPLVGEKLSLHIHTAVREDAIDLYGFFTEDELFFFKQLMSVSGIGPKTALGIMGTADLSSLKRSIVGGDTAALTNVFGIGKKSSERLVVELREKIKLPATAVASGEGGDAELIEALVGLGYSMIESRKALREAATNTSEAHEKLAAALRYLGTLKV
jgi:Holliday junction DNA helicase RuvA